MPSRALVATTPALGPMWPIAMAKLARAWLGANLKHFAGLLEHWRLAEKQAKIWIDKVLLSLSHGPNLNL